MVQLLRLTTDDKNAIFNNQFRDEIYIEKNSKVALHSLTCEINVKSIVIDAQNNEVLFKLSGGNNPQVEYRQCFLSHGEYTAANFADLLVDATRALNSAVVCNNSEVGRQWEVVEDNGKLIFNVKIGKYIQAGTNDPNIAYLVGMKNVAPMPPASKNYTRSDGVEGTNDAFMWFKSPNCKGSCSFSGRVYQRTNNEGFILAYLAEPPTDQTEIIDDADILYGVEFVSTAALPGDVTPYYNTIINGVRQVSNVAPVVSAVAGNAGSDYLSIDTGSSQIVGRIYRGNERLDLFTLPYNHMTNLFPVIIFKGSNASRVNGIKFNSDPVYNVDNTIQFKPVIDTDDKPLSIPFSGVNVPTVKSLRFGDIDLSKMLGFNDIEEISPEAVNEYAFEAANFFTLGDLADSFVIELLNIPLNSYDGLTHQRRNILHVVVQMDVIKERLTYVSPYPLYIDMNNANTLSLREVRARILREDLTPVEVSGFSQLTILIEK